MSIKIIKKGIADSLQDKGRYGYQHLGIQPGGPMDFLSAQLANYILANELHAPVIEIHFPASVFEFEATNVICITGAHFIPILNEKSIQLHTPIQVKKGDRLSFMPSHQGKLGYIGFKGTIATTPWLESHSKIATYLQTGELIPINQSFESNIDLLQKKDLTQSMEKHIFNTAPIRFIPGPAWNELSEQSTSQLLSQAFYTTLQSNRMGYLLKGPLLNLKAPKTYLSSAVTRGTLQLLPSGDIIVLMADHQTIGGYPNLGQIILVDLPRFAQLENNKSFHFSVTNVVNAQQLYQQLQTQFTN